jgi:hypothetical protein
MGKIEIPYYTVRRNGRGFWEPTRKMRALGFQSVPCGVDGLPIARRNAQTQMRISSSTVRRLPETSCVQALHAAIW